MISVLLSSGPRVETATLWYLTGMCDRDDNTSHLRWINNGLLTVLCLVDLSTADDEIEMCSQSIDPIGKNGFAVNDNPQYEAMETQVFVRISTFWPE